MDSRTTFELRRPFGAGAATSTNNPCTLKPQLAAGQQPSKGLLSTDNINYTHIMEVAGDFDIRDGCTRTAGNNILNYSDGDEVRIPDAGGSRYVVVYVERIITPPGTPDMKRAYLLRDTPTWPGP